MMFAHAQRFLFVSVCVSALVGPCLVNAESIEGALSRAYTSNPDLNAQRAALRALDEGVAKAAAAGRPKLNGIGDYGIAEIWDKNLSKSSTTTKSRLGAQMHILTTTFHNHNTRVCFTWNFTYSRKA